MSSKLRHRRSSTGHESRYSEMTDKKISVYISTSLRHIAEARAAAISLERDGFKVTSTWHLDDISPDTERDLSMSALRSAAKANIDELTLADVVLCLRPPQVKERVGHIFEVGWAAAKGMPVCVVEIAEMDSRKPADFFPSIMFFAIDAIWAPARHLDDLIRQGDLGWACEQAFACKRE